MNYWFAPSGDSTKYAQKKTGLSSQALIGIKLSERWQIFTGIGYATSGGSSYLDTLIFESDVWNGTISKVRVKIFNEYKTIPIIFEYTVSKSKPCIGIGAGLSINQVNSVHDGKALSGAALEEEQLGAQLKWKRRSRINLGLITTMNISLPLSPRFGIHLSPYLVSNVLEEKDISSKEDKHNTLGGMVLELIWKF